MSGPRIFKIGLATLTAAGVAYGAWRLSRKESGATSAFGKRLGIVSRMDILQKVTFSGTIHPQRKTVVLPPYEGYIKKIFVNVGDRIRRGDPVISFSQTNILDESSYPVRAPFEGIVVQVNAAEGEFVRPGGGNDKDKALIRIDDLSALHIRANIPELDFVKLQIGQGAVIKAVSILDRSYNGKVSQLSLAAQEQDRWDAGNVEFPVRIEVANHDALLKPGMSAIVDVVIDERRNVLAVAHEYIEKTEKGYFVTLENGDRRAVTLGIQNEQVAEITSGLDEGAKVKQVDFLALSERNNTGL